MYIVRAEYFSANPVNIMSGVYKYLEEPYYEMDYTNVKQMTIENDRIGDFGIYGDHKIKSNIQPLKKESNDILGSVLCGQIKAGNQWFYDAFKYY
jgi:hypothetical protein